MGEKTCYSKVRDAFTTRNVLAKVLFAEFLGTFVLIVLGDGSVAQHLLSRGGSGQFLSVNIAWGLAVAMGVWISGESSGGHINPAVTFAFCIMGRCPWSHFPIYWIGQYLGAIAGSAVVFGVYYEALEAFDGGVRVTDPLNVNATAGIWATYPKEYLTSLGGFGDQIVGTAILVMLVCAITDENNHKPPKGMVPFCVGLVVMVIGLSLGHNCGYAINPARDWGPRIFTCMAGWGKEPFTYRDFDWFWVPFAGPHVGAVLGGWLYVLFVGNHIRPEDHEEISAVRTKSKPDRNQREMNDIPPQYADYDDRRQPSYQPYSRHVEPSDIGMSNPAFTDDGPYHASDISNIRTPIYRRPSEYMIHPATKRPPYNAYETEKSFL